jgi:hypothetical protein
MAASTGISVPKMISRRRPSLLLWQARPGIDWSRLFEGATSPPLTALLTEYFSPRHRDEPGKGCPLAALGAEVARRGARSF